MGLSLNWKISQEDGKMPMFRVSVSSVYEGKNKASAIMQLKQDVANGWAEAEAEEIFLEKLDEEDYYCMGCGRRIRTFDEFSRGEGYCVECVP